MKRSEVIGYLSDLTDAAYGVDVSVGVWGEGDGMGDVVDASFALSFVAATLLFCVELLKPDAVAPDPKAALMSIMASGINDYLTA